MTQVQQSRLSENKLRYRSNISNHHFWRYCVINTKMSLQCTLGTELGTPRSACPLLFWAHNVNGRDMFIKNPTIMHCIQLMSYLGTLTKSLQNICNVCTWICNIVFVFVNRELFLTSKNSAINNNIYWQLFMLWKGMKNRYFRDTMTARVA